MVSQRCTIRRGVSFPSGLSELEEEEVEEEVGEEVEEVWPACR
jgi:hypothetical protein